MNDAGKTVFRAGRRQARRLDLDKGRVEMNHGAGGRAMSDLIDLLLSLIHI